MTDLALVVMSIGLVIFGIFFIALAVDVNQGEAVPAFFILGVAAVVASLLFMYTAGNGNLADSLQPGDMREVICIAPGKYINGMARIGGLLRKPDGSLEAQFLKREPSAKHFVVTSDENNPYVPYPAK